MSISTEIARLQQAKADLKTAIEAKGVTVPAATTIDGYAALVDQIQQGGVLPYDAEVEWIQTDGAAYIDTEIKATSSITTEGEYNITSNLGGNFAVFGGRVAINNNSNVLYHYQNQGNITNGWRFGNGEKTGNAGNAIGTFIFSNKENARAMKINNITLTCASSTFTTVYNVFIFAMNNGGVVGGGGAKSVVLKLKYLKMYSSGVLVRDYIPVRKNGVGYLYDKVTKTLFGNANSTGAFVYGNDVT